jgi:hypothetical protein
MTLSLANAAVTVTIAKVIMNVIIHYRVRPRKGIGESGDKIKPD